MRIKNLKQHNSWNIRHVRLHSQHKIVRFDYIQVVKMQNKRLVVYKKVLICLEVLKFVVQLCQKTACSDRILSDTCINYYLLLPLAK